MTAVAPETTRRQAARRWLLVATLVACTASAAENPIVTLAATSYRGGDYQEVIRLLERALASGLEPTSSREAGRLLLGAAYFAVQDAERARSALRALLTDTPGLVVDAAAFPPPFLALVDELRTEVKQRERPEPSRERPPVPAPAKVEPPPSPAASRFSRWWSAVPAVVAVGSGVASGVLLVGARDRHLALTRPLEGSGDVLLPETAARLAQEGGVLQGGGVGSLVLAGAAVVTAVVLWLLGAP